MLAREGIRLVARPTRLAYANYEDAIVLLRAQVADTYTPCVAGKDVHTAFAVRMGLFIAVTLYACGMIFLIDNRPDHRSAQRAIT